MLVLASLGAPLITPYSPNDAGTGETGWRRRPRRTGWVHDELGRDLYTRVIYGGRITLGMVVAVVALVAPGWAAGR